MSLLALPAMSACNGFQASTDSADLVESDELAGATDASMRGDSEADTSQPTVNTAPEVNADSGQPNIPASSASHTDGGQVESMVDAADDRESQLQAPAPSPQVECCGCVDWVVSAGGTTAVVPGDLVVDSDGSTVITGSFSERGTFGDIELPSQGLSDMFVARLDDRGRFLWASAFGGPSYDSGNDISVAIAPDGSLRLAGGLLQPITFGVDSDNETTVSGQAFIAEFTSSGDFGSVTTLEASTWVFFRDLGVTEDGGVVIAGDLNGSLTFGSGADGEVTRSITNSSFFGASYDSEGAVRWVVGPSGERLTSQTLATALDVSPAGEVLITGMVSGTSTEATLGAGSAQATNLWGANGAAFVARYQADGSLAWARQNLPVSSGIECTDVCVESYGQSTGNAVAFASNGDTLVAGWISSGQFIFGEGEPTEATFDGPTGYLARWSESGVLLWVVSVGEGWPVRIAETSDGSIWLAGTLSEGTHVFGAGQPTETTIEVPDWERPDVGTAINVDAFVARFDSTGNFLCAWHPSPSVMAHRAWGLDAHPDGGVVVTGHFEGTVDFGTEGDPKSLTTDAEAAAFVVKLLP